MTKQVSVSRDGSWKVEVEAFKINLFVYNAIGVTTRVYARSGNGSWRAQKVDAVEALGTMGTSRLPGVMVPLPTSPNARRADDSADTRAWSVGIGITHVFDAPWVGFPPNPGPSGGPSMLVDRVTGTGSATWRGETLRVGPISQF